MHRLHRIARRHGRRLARPVLLFALVLAQAVTAFGFPLARPRGGSSPCDRGECGCGVGCGSAENCCCKPAAPKPPPPPPAAPACGSCGKKAGACCCTEPEDEPAGCPLCAATEPSCCAGKEPPPPPVEAAPVRELTWVFAWQARQCRGEGPLGIAAEVLSIPPAFPARLDFSPVPAGMVTGADTLPVSRPSLPLEPPPRSA